MLEPCNVIKMCKWKSGAMHIHDSTIRAAGDAIHRRQRRPLWDKRRRHISGEPTQAFAPSSR